jgi:predicted RNase H-like nuclease (RuvC/YqgF family)
MATWKQAADVVQKVNQLNSEGKKTTMIKSQLDRAIARQAVRIDDLETELEQFREDSQEWLATIKAYSKILAQVKGMCPNVEDVAHLPGAVLQIKEELDRVLKNNLGLAKKLDEQFAYIQELEEKVSELENPPKPRRKKKTSA